MSKGTADYNNLFLKVVEVIQSQSKTEYPKIFKKEILDINLDVNQVDSKGLSLLHYAVNSKQIEFVKFLLSQGANPDLGGTDENGRTTLTPAIMALQKQDIDILELLIKYGANPDTLRKFIPQEPIYYSGKVTHTGLPETCANIISNRMVSQSIASGYIKKNPITFLDAIKNGYASFVASYLNKYNTAANELVDSSPIKAGSGFDALMTPNPKLREFVDSRKAHLANIYNKPSASLIHPLQVAIDNEDFQIGRLLIEKGADINLCTIEGMTPQAYASKMHHVPLLDILRVASANQASGPQDQNHPEYGEEAYTTPRGNHVANPGQKRSRAAVPEIDVDEANSGYDASVSNVGDCGDDWDFSSLSSEEGMYDFGAEDEYKINLTPVDLTPENLIPIFEYEAIHVDAPLLGGDQA